MLIFFTKNANIVENLGKNSQKSYFISLYMVNIIVQLVKC